MSEGISHPLILVDTNVWLDALIPSRARHQCCARLLEVAVGSGATLLYPVRVLSDVFFMVQRCAKDWFRSAYGVLTEEAARACRSMAWDRVHDMRLIATAVGEDEADVWLACKYRAIHEDLEDNFVLAAAKRAHADYVVSSDRELQRRAPLACVSPDQMLVILEEGL